jgi:hypothetical protein
MPSETADRGEELYIVEVNGVKSSEHRIFIEALKCGLELKRCFPRSEVKLRDASERRLLKTLQRRSGSGGFGRVARWEFLDSVARPLPRKFYNK